MIRGDAIAATVIAMVLTVSVFQAQFGAHATAR